MRVVVHGEALRVARREVRVRLGGMAELAFERAAEFGERRPGEMESLEDDCRACLELGSGRGSMSAVPVKGAGRQGMLVV